MIIPEADLLFEFGYDEALNQLASEIPSGVFYQLSAIKIGA